MKIVIDTNVVISGVFFGGKPRMILEAVADRKIFACASAEILTEYYTVSRLLQRHISAILTAV